MNAEMSWKDRNKVSFHDTAAWKDGGATIAPSNEQKGVGIVISR